MSKVGILSMQRIKNYGSFLQAFALKTMIEKFSNEIILFSSKSDKISIHNHQLNNSSKYDSKRDVVLNIYKESNYKRVEKYYRKYKGIKYYIKTFWYKIPYKIRKIIKK